jgi:hypothetical protein
MKPTSETYIIELRDPKLDLLQPQAHSNIGGNGTN